MRGLLGARVLRGASALPWTRAASEAQPTSGTPGRGRGQHNVNASKVFGSSSPGASQTREELAQIVGGWKQNKPRQPHRPQGRNNQNLERGDLSKILGDVINRKPADGSQDATGGGSGGNQPPPVDAEPVEDAPELPLVYSDLPEHLDMPTSPKEMEDLLNKRETIEKLGKIMGTQRPPKIRFHLTGDHVPEPALPDIAGDMGSIFSEQNVKMPFTKAESKQRAERTLWSGHVAEEEEINTLREFIQAPDENAMHEERADVFENALQNTEVLADHNITNIRGFQQHKGRQDGQTMDQFCSNPAMLYDANASQLDPLFEKVIETKCAKEPEFAAEYAAFRPKFDSLSDARDVAEKEHGEDDERTLQLESQLHREAKKILRRMKMADYEVVDLPLYQDITNIPLHEDYRGPDGDAQLQRDFENQQVKLLSYDDAVNQLPKATNDYVNGLEEGLSGGGQMRDLLCFHATERLGSNHNLIHNKAVADAYEGQRWENIGLSASMPMPTSFRDFMATQSIVMEYYQHTNDFRQHLENFIVTRLTKELRLLKEDTADFSEVSQRLDQIRQKKRKKVESRAIVLERAKQRSIENGTYTPPTESIITRALARKGVVEEEDILDQALEYLRRDGKKFTHKDIPSIRKDNYEQKFRAIYFNGSLKPHDKARMVALTISNFIVSTDELRVAGGALQVMSSNPTAFEKQEKEMEANKGGQTVNLDMASVSFNKEKVKASRLITKRKGEVSWEGYDTEDFEQPEEEDNSIPAEFDGLAKFQPHSHVFANWSKVVDTTLDTSSITDPNMLAQNATKAVAEVEDTDEFELTTDSEE